MRQYEKHQLYTSSEQHYTTQRGGRIVLPDSCRWTIHHFQGKRRFAPAGQEAGPIVLILDDLENYFWPVISFLTTEEVKDLRKQIDKALGIEPRRELPNDKV